MIILPVFSGIRINLVVQIITWLMAAAYIGSYIQFIRATTPLAQAKMQKINRTILVVGIAWCIVVALVFMGGPLASAEGPTGSASEDVSSSALLSVIYFLLIVVSVLFAWKLHKSKKYIHIMVLLLVFIVIWRIVIPSVFFDTAKVVATDHLTPAATKEGKVLKKSGLVNNKIVTSTQTHDTKTGTALYDYSNDPEAYALMNEVRNSTDLNPCTKKYFLQKGDKELKFKVFPGAIFNLGVPWFKKIDFTMTYHEDNGRLIKDRPVNKGFLAAMTQVEVGTCSTAKDTNYVYIKDINFAEEENFTLYVKFVPSR